MMPVWGWVFLAFLCAGSLLDIFFKSRRPKRHGADR
jgi:hypothetical protein